MSDLEKDDLPQVDELTALKARADLMGISYHPSIGVDKLRAKVAQAISGEKEDDDVAEAPVAAAPVQETENQRRLRLKNEANELVRIRVTCMNPAKREWKGEIFTTANSVVGTFKKFVPFEVEDGWHVPRIIYEMMKHRECTTFVTEKTKNGVDVPRVKLIKEFAIDVLPNLTKQELEELARRQAMAAGQSV